MSEVVESGGLTAGGLLREARQASGMHIAALAVALKVPVNKLEALEADNFTVLPDTVFVRALASSVCRVLKVDPAPILALLPQSPSPSLAADSAGINAPVKGSVGKSTVSSSSFSGNGSASRSVGFVVLALLVGALALYFFPRGEDRAASSSASAPVLSSAPDAVPTGAADAPAAERPSEPAPAPAATAPAPTLVAAPALSAAVTAAPATATAPAAASAPVVGASAPAPAADAPAGTLVLRARSESWVQVKDATGALALQRNLAAGESVSVSAQPPLAVVVGRADATEVTVRGKPFDLAAVSRDNVARFEVK
ncbi:helix-turn-helix domain-containing protein [Acidovorax sp. Q11]